MPYIGLSPDLPRADITPVSTSNVTSISCNFDSSIVVLGYANENNNTGKVEVYEYFRGSDLWQSRGIIDGPHTNSYFGKSLDTDWDTERIVVGANAASNVYVYDWDGSAFQNYSNIIESPSGTGSDFGFSVRIAKNNPDIITVGSPAHNNVFVYQLVNSSWVETFSNTGTDIQNLAPYSNVNDKVYDTSNNLVTTTEYNRYGESVAISNNGNYIIIGQPGTALANLNATNTTNYNIVEENQKLEGNVVVATRFYLFDSDNQNKQLGSVRVFKTTDGLWNTSNSQVGSLLYGERNFVINQNRSILPGNIPTVSWMNVGWGFPAFGSSVDINDNGDLIVVGSPLYGLYTSYGGNSGKIYTYKLLKDEFGNDIWVEINTLLGTRLSRYGLNIKLDFAGTRMVVNGCNNELDILGIYDLNQEIWYNSLPLILFNGTLNLEVSLHVTDGKTVITSRTLQKNFNEDTIGNYILFYNVDLTQAFSGNSTFSGYISASQLYVGANDSLNESTSEYSRSKRISFGGTFNDNTYENTIIENRVYKENDLGLSELILSKVPSDANDSLRGVDIIRVKGVEIHLDSWNQIDDNRYEHHPVLVITQDTCVGIGHSKVDFSDQGGYYLNSVDTHAILDVNGSGYIRNKLNVHYDGRSEILGYLRSQGALFWDTRRYDTVDGTNVFSNTWPAPSKFPERFSFTSTMSNDVSYSKSNYAFDFGTGSGSGAGQIDTGIVGLISSSSETPKISLWFKLKNEQSQYNNNKIFSYGDPTGSRVEFIITTTGIELKFYHLTNTYTLSSTYSFIKNKWYHFYCKLNPPQSESPSTTSVDIYINDIELTTSETGTNIMFDYTGRFILGGGILNAYIGMVNLWLRYVSRAPSPKNLYNNGPPDELLSIGGTATIQNKLGVGVTNPTEALEVSGNVHADYFVGDGSQLTNIQNTLQEVTDEGSSTNQTLYLTNTGTSLVTDGNVGVGTTSPSSLLTVNNKPAHDDFFNHSEAPLSVHYNAVPTSSTILNDPKPVMHLTREGTSSQAYAARATFKLSRYENSGFDSRTRLDIVLADGSYDDRNVMTMRSNGDVTIPGYYIGGPGTVIQEHRENVTTIAAYFSGGTSIQINEFTMTVTKRQQNSVIALNYVVNCEAVENNVFKIYRNGLLITGNGFNLYGVASAAYDVDYNSTIENIVIDYVDSPPTTGEYTYTLSIVGTGNYFYLNRTAGSASADSIGGYYENTISTKGYKEICT
jgi:hypothetical protein